MRGKKGITLIAGIVLLVLLVLLYLMLHSGNKDGEDTEEEVKTSSVAALEEADMASVSFGAKDNMLTFIQEDNIWYLEADKNFPVDQPSLSDLLSKLSDVQALRTIEEPENLGEYGLEDPQTSIIVTGTDGEKTSFYIGDDNTVVSGCYMYLNDASDRVYLIDSELKTSFLCGLYDLAEKASFPAITSSSITKYRIDKEDGQFVLNEDSNSKTGWTVTCWDGTTKPAASDAVSNTFTKLSSLSFTSYVNYKEDSLEQYGLTNPTAVITADYTETVQDESSEESSEDSGTSGDSQETTVDRQLVISVGKKDESGNYYVKTEGVQGIYTISAEELNTLLDDDITPYLDTYVNKVSFADLSKLEVVKDQTVYTVVSKSVEVESSEEDNTEDEEEQKTELKYYMNDQEIDSAEFLAFYEKVSGMESNSRLDSMPEVASKPELTIKFYDKDSGEETDVAYYAYDSNFYLTIDNHNNYLLVNKMDVREMLEKLDNLLTDTQK